MKARPWPAGEWRQRLADSVTDLGELLEMLELDAELVGAGPTSEAARRFPVRVPRGFVARMRRGDPADPLLRQVLPVADEDREAPGFSVDPVGELAIVRGDGVLAKYHGRALLVATGACAVHCRYCFRRHFPYDDERAGGAEWSAAVAAVAADPSLDEVILSGGDPLLLPDRRLAELAEALAAVPRVRRLRIHTRLPVVLPERVDEALAAWLEACPLPVVVVIHANHPNEIDRDVTRALEVLRGTGALLLNQAVLLAGVNDEAGALEELCRRLGDRGVLPYYLHLLDRVAGAVHFEVAEPRALEIVSTLRARLPGYLVPRLVREVPGAPSKVVVA
ncbi:MAG TPA: EF-P beta-lysylation protein EpmB [Methylomirabilota bacterium]|nr:EF-P beta-lysylation protein EpmB [Methylomirabilota bacterium]